MEILLTTMYVSNIMMQTYIVNADHLRPRYISSFVENYVAEALVLQYQLALLFQPYLVLQKQL